jgi:hypothetical protein
MQSQSDESQSSTRALKRAPHANRSANLVSLPNERECSKHFQPIGASQKVASPNAARECAIGGRNFEEVADSFGEEDKSGREAKRVD